MSTGKEDRTMPMISEMVEESDNDMGDGGGQ